MTAVALLGSLAWALFDVLAPEPVYMGKSLSYWLAQLDPGSAQWESSDSVSAIRQIGADAIPSLLKMLRAQDPPPRKPSPLQTELRVWVSWLPFRKTQATPAAILNVRASYGFQALGPRAARAVPRLKKMLDQTPSPNCRSSIASILAFIGPDAKAAVPSLMRAAANTNENLQINVIWALGQIHADPDAVVPFLTKKLRDPDVLTRELAVGSLAKFRADAKPAEPALVQLLNTPGPDTSSPSISPASQSELHATIEFALEQIDPETYVKVASNPAPVSTMAN
jgi:HEAT repeat protein